MITFIKWIRLWRLKTKWQFALWQFIDNQMVELIKSPEELEKKFVDSLAKTIHETNQHNQFTNGT